MSNPLRMLKNINMKGLIELMDSVHARLENIQAETEKQTSQNEEMIRLLEQIKNNTLSK